MRRIVLVSGLPGSGKSTLARPLARELGLPLFSKDDLKESLADSLGVPDLDASIRLGRASIMLLYVLAGNAAAVIESAHGQPEWTTVHGSRL